MFDASWIFIAKKIYYDSDGEKRFSRPAIRIAILGVAVGIIVMIVSISVVLGFKKEISSKVLGFGAHAQIVNTTINENYEINPLIINDALINDIKTAIPKSEIQFYISKLGMLKTDSDFCGINFKGVGEDYNLDFFASCLVDGVIPTFSSIENTNNILVSQSTANTLKLKIGIPVYAYFLSSENVRSRKFTVAGIYNTHLKDYDKSLVFTDIYTMRRLNKWDSTMVSGCEIYAENHEELYVDLNNLSKKISSTVPHDNDKQYKVFSFQQQNPQIFSWLDILDTNIIMILVLMICVSSVTVSSGLLIIMLERINMIRLLKILGANNSAIRNVFIHFAIFVVSRGLLIGNIFAIVVCYIQKLFSFIPLDASVYYIDSVPIDLNWKYVILINILTIVVSFFIIWGTSLLVSVKKTIHIMNTD